MSSQLQKAASFDIVQALEQRILILDGAMGTMVQQFKLREEDYRGALFADHSTNLKNNNDILCLTRPDVIAQIHRQYLEAGADIIETNTFNATVISQADFGLEQYVPEINRAAAQLARKAVDQVMASDPNSKRYVAGSIGPLTRTLSISRDLLGETSGVRALEESAEAIVAKKRSERGEERHAEAKAPRND